MARFLGQLVHQQLEHRHQQVPGGGDLRRAALVAGLHQNRHLAQGFLFHLPAVVAIDHQPAGDDHQIGARIAQRLQRLLAQNQPQKGVLAQVRRVLGAAQPPVQPVRQPAVVRRIQLAQFPLGTGQQGLAVGGGAGHRIRFAFIIESDYQLKGGKSATVNRTLFFASQFSGNLRSKRVTCS